jgi:hypothetical protein
LASQVCLRVVGEACANGFQHAAGGLGDCEGYALDLVGCGVRFRRASGDFCREYHLDAIPHALCSHRLYLPDGFRHLQHASNVDALDGEVADRRIYIEFERIFPLLAVRAMMLLGVMGRDVGLAAFPERDGLVTLRRSLPALSRFASIGSWPSPSNLRHSSRSSRASDRLTS